MPCSSGGYEPSSYELMIKNVVGLLCYVYGWLDIAISDELHKATKELTYFNKKQGDKWVNALCTVLNSMPEDERDQLVYARCRMSRRLADWWEDHVEEDAQKFADETIKKYNADLREFALNKLTKEEIEVLGLC